MLEPCFTAVVDAGARTLAYPTAEEARDDGDFPRPQRHDDSRRGRAGWYRPAARAGARRRGHADHRPRRRPDEDRGVAPWRVVPAARVRRRARGHRGLVRADLGPEPPGGPGHLRDLRAGAVGPGRRGGPGAGAGRRRRHRPDAAARLDGRGPLDGAAGRDRVARRPPRRAQRTAARHRLPRQRSLTVNLEQAAAHKRGLWSLPPGPPARRVERMRPVETGGFVAAVSGTEGGVIASVAPASWHAVTEYVAGGAAAVSVPGDELVLGGGPELVCRVSALVDVPVLWWDVIVDPRQVDMAYACGADAVRVAVGALDDAELAEV